jgi:hypothetical protein
MAGERLWLRYGGLSADQLDKHDELSERLNQRPTIPRNISPGLGPQIEWKRTIAWCSCVPMPKGPKCFKWIKKPNHVFTVVQLRLWVWVRTLETGVIGVRVG